MEDFYSLERFEAEDGEVSKSEMQIIALFGVYQTTNIKEGINTAET